MTTEEQRVMISLGIHNVALSFVGVNGREERQQVEDLQTELPETWQSEWLRVRARALKDDRLQGWADYYEKVQNEVERSFPCAKV